MICLILAGGFGKRLWPLTEDTAKPLLLVNGEEVITSLVRKIPKGIPVFLSTNRRFEGNFIKWKEKAGRNIEIFVEDAREEKEKLGAVKSVSFFIKEKKIEDDLFLLGGDNLFHFDFGDFMGHYRGKTLVAVHDIKDKEKARNYGVVRLSDEKIVEVQEKPENPSSTLVSTACYIFPKDTFPLIHDFTKGHKDNLGSFLSFLVEREEVFAYVFEESWYDIGTFESYFEAHKSMHSNVFPQSVKFLGKNDIKGKVYLGEDCVVSDSYIEDSMIFEGAVIENSCIVNCLVAGGTRLKDKRIKGEIVKG